MTEPDTQCRKPSTVLTQKEMTDWQIREIRNMVARCKENSSFYANHLQGADPQQLITYRDLENLPFTFPRDIIADPFAFLCVSPGDIARITTLSTSGTTGNKKRIFFTEHDLLRTVDFFRDRIQCMISPGQHALVLLSDSTENSIGDLLKKALVPLNVSISIREKHWTSRDALHAAEDADLLVSTPQDALYLCQCRPDLSPSAVLLSGDYIPRCVMEILEKRWSTAVFTHYGLTESGFGCAVQCAKRGFHHIRHPELLVEIIDPASGKQVPQGDCGEITLTMFRNEAMPLLRYRTGDCGRLVSPSCDCEKNLDCLDGLWGRYENMLLLRDGSPLSIHALDEILYSIDGVKNYTARYDQKKNILFLAMDCCGKIDRNHFKRICSPSLSIKIEYASADPFLLRAKRKIELI